MCRIKDIVIKLDEDWGINLCAFTKAELIVLSNNVNELVEIVDEVVPDFEELEF